MEKDRTTLFCISNMPVEVKNGLAEIARETGIRSASALARVWIFQKYEEYQQKKR